MSLPSTRMFSAGMTPSSGAATDSSSTVSAPSIVYSTFSRVNRVVVLIWPEIRSSRYISIAAIIRSMSRASALKIATVRSSACWFRSPPSKASAIIWPITADTSSSRSARSRASLISSRMLAGVRKARRASSDPSAA
jgi:hypothetical protein